MKNVRDTYTLHSPTQTSAKNARAKTWTNEAIARSLKRVTESAGNSCDSDSYALVLDGSEGWTSHALHRIGSFPMERIISPNLDEDTVAALKSLGVCASHGRVEDLLRSPVDGRCQLVYLDHTGALPSRIWQVREACNLVLNTSGVGGGVVAFTFSERSGNFPPGEELGWLGDRGSWGGAKALYAIVHAVVNYVESRGGRIEGVGGENLCDYVFCSPPPSDDFYDGEVADIVRTFRRWDIKQYGEPKQKEINHLINKGKMIAQKVLPEGSQIIGKVLKHRGEAREESYLVTSYGRGGNEKDLKMLRKVRSKLFELIGREKWPSNSTRIGGEQVPEDGNRSTTLLKSCCLAYPSQMVFVALRIYPGQEKTNKT